MSNINRITGKFGQLGQQVSPGSVHADGETVVGNGHAVGRAHAWQHHAQPGVGIGVS